jgi:hypothetical protein
MELNPEQVEVMDVLREAREGCNATEAEPKPELSPLPKPKSKGNGKGKGKANGKAGNPCVYHVFGLCTFGEKCRNCHDAPVDLKQLDSAVLFSIANARQKAERVEAERLMKEVESSGLSDAAISLIRSQSAGAIRRRR